MADGSLRGVETPWLDELQLAYALRCVMDADLICRAREDPNVFVEVCGRIEGQQWVGTQAGAHRMWQDHMTRASAQPGASTAVLLAPVGHAKALPTDTPILTPTGWRKIGELKVGDLVIGGDGKPTMIMDVSPVWTDREVFELTFDDGTSLRADADHQWAAWTVNDRSEGKPPRTATTREIIAKFTRSNGQRYWSIPLAEPAEMPAADLPVDPYVLGVWLGDGATDCARITCHEDDAEIVNRCIDIEGGRCGARVYQRVAGVVTRTFNQTIGGVPDKRANRDPRNLRGRLRKLGVLGNKHIPQIYLLASIEQRRALLAGLLDTDGSLQKCGRVEFANTNRALAQAVLELARSLGFKATISEGRSKLAGVDKGPAFKVGWTCAVPVFRMARKAAAHAAAVAKRAAQARPGRVQRNSWDSRTITSWRRVESVPVRCIAVAAEHHTYVATNQYIVTHNTTQITRWRVLWEIGKNPNLRVLIMSATSQLPEGVLSGIKGDITDNPFVQAVFPRLRPGRKPGQMDWSSTRIHVDRDDNLPDPTIQCAGLTTKILGKRLDLIVIDDLLNTDNTLTPYMRKQVSDRVESEVMSRRVPHLRSRAWVTGHVWTDDDFIATLCARPGVRRLRCGARVQRHKDGHVITSADPEWSETLGWLPLLPNIFSKERLAARYAELRWAARHMLDNLFMRKNDQGFSQEGVARALLNGRGIKYKATWNPLATGAPTYTGVDVSSGEGDDFTVVITVARLPTGRRQILEIQSGKWTGPQIIEVLKDVKSRYMSTIAVESNGVQKWVRQWMMDSDAFITPVLDHKTGKNKHALGLGIKHMEMELSGSGMWIFPRPSDILDVPDPEMRQLCDGMLGYSREGHTSDWLMALWIAWYQIVKDEGLALQ